MKYLLALILGFGSLSAVACKSAETVDMRSSEAVIDVTGMT